jgi:hypothetical protein
MVKAMAPDGRMVFASPEQANKMNQAYAAELSANTQAQKDFLASDAAKEISNRQLRSVQNSTYSQESKAREARLAARPDFGAAISDRERRGTGGMSMADALDLAGGDRKKARAMIVSQRLGRDPFTGATGQTAADRAKSDLELATAIQSYNQAQAAEQRRIAAEGRAVRGEERTVAQIAKEDAHANKTQEMRERELRLKEARLMNDISQVDPSTIPTIDAAQEFMDENDLVWDGGVLYSKSGWLNGTLTEVTNPAFMNVKGMKILRDLSRGTAVPANTATPDYSGYSIRPR